VITVPRLDAAAEARVRSALHDSAHVDVERIAAPRQRLEDLFLRIVEQARADRATTSGALAGGPTAAFLLGEDAGRGEGSELIAALESAPAPAQAASAAAAPVPAAPAADRAELDRLVAPPPPAPAAPAAAQPPAAGRPGAAPPRPAPDVDRGVIDDLLGGGGRP
jgi:hypothetical protein